MVLTPPHRGYDADHPLDESSQLRAGFQQRKAFKTDRAGFTAAARTHQEKLHKFKKIEESMKLTDAIDVTSAEEMQAKQGIWKLVGNQAAVAEGETNAGGGGLQLASEVNAITQAIGASKLVIDPSASPVVDRHTTASRKVAKAHSAALEGKNLIDLVQVAEKMEWAFAMAPAQYAGKFVVRRRNLASSECWFFVGKTLKRAKWKHFFDSGILGNADRFGSADWRQTSVVVPGIAANLPEKLPRRLRGKGYLIVWEDPYSTQISKAVEPMLVRHIVGDVYEVLAQWTLTDLEVAALRVRM